MDLWAVRLMVWSTSLLLGAIRGFHGYQKPRSTVTTRNTGVVQTIVLAIAFVGFIVPLFWASSRWLHEANYATQPVVQIVGIVVIAAGLWLFNQTHVDIGRNWSSTLQIVRDQELVTSGIYARVRHPMYLSLIVFALGQALLIPNWFAGPACLIGCVVLASLRMRAEERMLADRFGKAYQDYASRTPALVPRTRRTRRT